MVLQSALDITMTMFSTFLGNDGAEGYNGTRNCFILSAIEITETLLTNPDTSTVSS